MARDCFGNPTQFPPSIADTFADIQRFKAIPLAERMEYHQARTDYMVRGGDLEDLWDHYWSLCLRVA